MCVLFVEDEPLIAMIAAEVLEEAGHEVLAAENANIAIGYMMNMSGRFSCLVTDVNMPGELTGIDLVNWARGLYPVIPIILTTALAHVISRPWMQRQQVMLMEKPYLPNALVTSVAGLLASRN